MTLLDPREYWKKVPSKWKPFWHFYNTPISADSEHADSPVRLIKQIASPGSNITSYLMNWILSMDTAYSVIPCWCVLLGDFVSFKLDIDHPDTEMPVALSLLEDEKLASLVDEFFFELHFRCSQCHLLSSLHFPFHSFQSHSWLVECLSYCLLQVL